MRIATVYVLATILVILAQPTPASVTVGFGFVALGEAIRFWAAGHLRKTIELITSGPYRYTRNPLYLGRLLVFTGLCVMTRLPFGLHWLTLLLGYAVFFGYYLPRKERVERARRAKRTAAADRAAIFRAVPALILDPPAVPQGASTGWSSERMLRNREPWMVAALVGISLLLLWVAYVHPEGILASWLGGS